jgi:hypothetical protein
MDFALFQNQSNFRQLRCGFYRMEIGKKVFESSMLRMHNNSQGCQMLCFQTKNTNLGKLWRSLD